MASVNGIEVNEAANELGLSAQRIRALLAGGSLEGRKIAGRWFVFPESVQRMQLHRNVRGRQLSPGNAWALLFAASGQDPDWLSPWDRSRLQDRLASDWQRWLPRLRNRARIDRCRVHPGSLKKIQSDPRLVLSGASAKSQGADVIARDEVEAYVREGDLRALARDYKLEHSSRPNLILHAVVGDWPFGENQQEAPPAVVAVDLIESGNARSKRAGNALLRRLNKAWAR